MKLETQPWFDELRACVRCSCRAEARQVVPGMGPTDAIVMFLGQNPGEDEDADGRPFIGRAGKELDVWLSLLGLSRAQVAISNACHCHTTGNRAPTTDELRICTEAWFVRELEALPRLKVLVPLGKPALRALIGKEADRFPSTEFAAVEAEIADRVITLAPLAHPAYFLRAPGARPLFLSRVLPGLKDLLSRVGSPA